METKKEYTKEDLLAKKPEELDKIKVVHDILDAQDTRGWFERFLKDKLGPLIPVISGIIAIILFVNTCQDKKHNEFKEAQTRYTSELDLVKLVWDDVRDTINIKNAKKAADYILKINSLKNSFNTRDNEILGIADSIRPVQLLINSNPLLLNKVYKQEVSKDSIVVAPSSKSLAKVNDTLNPTSVRAIKTKEIKNTIDKIAKNQLTVYIQYSNQNDKATIDNLADKLKSYYVVPTIEYIPNKSNYQNEIRYNSEADLKKAIELAKKLKQLYTKDFQLRNINHPTIKNTIEVWIDNTNVNNQPTMVNPAIKNEANYTEETYKLFAAVRYFNYVNDAISVNVDGFDEKTQTATMRINNNKQFKVVVGQKSDNVGFGDYNIFITVESYGRKNNFSIRKAVYYQITIQKKK